MLANRGEICTHAHLVVLETALDHVFELGLHCHFHRLGFWCSLWLGSLGLGSLGLGRLGLGRLGPASRTPSSRTSASRSKCSAIVLDLLFLWWRHVLVC